MHSWRFRRVFILVFLTVRVVSVLWECPLPGRITVTMHFLGLLLIVVSAVLAF